MANICNFEMILKGELENRNQFLDAMEQESEYCMGRGAWIDYREDFENETHVTGDCKWSIISALYDNALSMKKQKETGQGHWYNGDGFIDNHIFIDFISASHLWDLEIEIVSWECGCEFSEYYLIQSGYVAIEEDCEYTEHYDEDPDTWTEHGGFEHLF